MFLCTHYRKPLDWNAKVVLDAQGALCRMRRACAQFLPEQLSDGQEHIMVHDDVMSALRDDMNTPLAIAFLHELVTKINKTCDTSDKLKLARVLDKSAKFMGLTSGFGEEKFSDEGVDNEKVQELIEKRSAARKKGDFALADEIRQHLLSMGIVVVDTKDGISFWKRAD